MASWIFTAWIGAGAGAGMLLHWLTSRLARGLRIAAAAFVISLPIAAHAVTAPSPQAEPFVSHFIHEPRDLDLIGAYLDRLDGYNSVGFVSVYGRNPAFAWTKRERCRCRAIIEEPPFSISSDTREEVRRITLEWLQRTSVQRIVVIDTFDRIAAIAVNWSADARMGMFDAMEVQDRFRRIERIPVPSYPAEVTVWQRGS